MNPTTIFGREPVLVLAAVNGTIAVIVGFTDSVTAVQTGLISFAVGAIIAVFARSKVSPAA